MQHAEYFKTFLKDTVNIDDTRLNKLGSRVEAVYKALMADPEIKPMITGKSRQGSWAQLTIVRPKPGGEFDADFLLLMNAQKGREPKHYLNAVYNALSNHPTYTKQEYGRKCRCVWLEYAPENGVGCHLDIVPLITLTHGSASSSTRAPSGTPSEACTASYGACGDGSRTRSVADSTLKRPSTTQSVECFIAPKVLPQWWRRSRCRPTSSGRASCAASGCGREPIIESTSHRGRTRPSPAGCPACLSSSPSTCHWAAAIICRIS